MIVYYTKYNVLDIFKIPDMLEIAFKCVPKMQNVPDTFKSVKWDGSKSGEWKDGRNTLDYEIDTERKLCAFRVAIVDKNDELWTVDIALNESNHVIQLRLARERTNASAEFDSGFNVPYIFKQLIKEGVASSDSGLPISDKPVIINMSNVSIVADIINGKTKYALPVILVSSLSSPNNYELDVCELAKDMAGSAHVLVEENKDVSFLLKNMTSSRNPYNGAIEVYYPDDSFRYFRWRGTTANQYRYKISHAIFLRMAMRNIDDECSLSTLRINNNIKELKSKTNEKQNLENQLNSLTEKYDDNLDFLKGICADNDELTHQNSTLSEENRSLKDKNRALIEQLKQKNESSEKCVSFLFTEEEFYMDEVKRIIIEQIGKAINGCGEDSKSRRAYHVLNDIVKNNIVSDEGERIKKTIEEALKNSGSKKVDTKLLTSVGFKLETGSHDKYIFNGDGRYTLTVSNSPSDYRSGENILHEAKNMLFGLL